MPRPGEFVLTLSCRDAKGIVHAVSGALLQADCNILDSQQFGDVSSARGTGLFFMRVHFEAPSSLHAPGRLDAVFDEARRRFGFSMLVKDACEKDGESFSLIHGNVPSVRMTVMQAAGMPA